MNLFSYANSAFLIEYIHIVLTLLLYHKSRKVLMMMKGAKLGWAGAGAGKKQGWTKSRARKGRSRAGQEQGRKQGWNLAGVG